MAIATVLATAKVKDFYILGPDMVRGNGVAEAIASLYYLPKRYKLILQTSSAILGSDDPFLTEMLQLVKRMALGRRVQFEDEAQDIPEADAIIVKSATPTDMRDKRMVVSAGSPEALASAILAASRRLVDA